MRYEDTELKRINKMYGEAMVRLVVEKSREIAAHNPSGAYPVKVRLSWIGARGITSGVVQG